MRARWVAAVGAAFALGTGIAEARVIRGTEGPDRLRGTLTADFVFGLGGNDRLEGRAGSDLLHGGAGRDVVLGAGGADFLAVHADNARDSVRCGGGRDVVNADPEDAVAADCEVVSRRLGRDPYASAGAQNETHVEPDTFAFGATMVAAYQVGRFTNGGAANLGFAASRDRGRTWRSGFLPSTTQFSSPAGTYEVITDPSVAYDPVRRLWLIASFAITESGDFLLVSRSGNGLDWSAPIVAVRAPPDTLDKPWIACDTWTRSPFRGRCYLSYLELTSDQILTRRSDDAGATWSAPVEPPRPLGQRIVNGAQPVTRPDGAVVVLYTDFRGFAGEPWHRIVAFRSTDGGVSFSAPVQVADVRGLDVRHVRAPPFVSAEVDAAGTIYAAWHDCFAAAPCDDTDILLSTSGNGNSWTRPRRVPTGPAPPCRDEFLPGLAVDPATEGASAHLAIVYHGLDQCFLELQAGIDVAVVTSADGGSSWSAPQRLNAETMPLYWIADSNIGRMLGDYISTSFVSGRPVPLFILAAESEGERFNQAAYALTRG